MNKLSLVFKGIKSEFNKIMFPTKEALIRNSFVVLVFSFIIGAMIFLLDNIIGFGFGFLLK